MRGQGRVVIGCTKSIPDHVNLELESNTRGRFASMSLFKCHMWSCNIPSMYVSELEACSTNRY